MNILMRADSLAHVLGRWHLIPGALLKRICNRYEDRLLVGSDELVPAGWTCPHTTVTFGPNVRMPRPTSWCGCTMAPVLR